MVTSWGLKLEGIEDKLRAESRARSSSFGMPGDLTGRISSTEEGFGKVLRRSFEATERGGRGKAQLTGT